MNFKLLFLSFLLAFNLGRSQNFAVSNLQMPKCFGDCDGSVTFTTSAVTGPFTAVLTNTGSCPNSTVQSSTMNSITIYSLCGCASDYSFSIYNPSMVLVGTMIQQIINYSTGTLDVNTSTITPATCSNCCDGDVTFTVTGGNQTNPPTFSINGTYTANVSPLYFLCVGTHTICVEDASGCIACKQFTMPYTGGPTGLNNTFAHEEFTIYPNPAGRFLTIQSAGEQKLFRIEVYDLTSRKIEALEIEEIPGGKTKIDLGALDSGLYYAMIYGKDGHLHRFKFIKKGE